MLGLDIAGLNHNAAWLSILLAVFVILELATCIMVLNHSAMTIIVTPVAKILGTIKENAQHVLKALDEDEVCGSTPFHCANLSSALFAHFLDADHHLISRFWPENATSFLFSGVVLVCWAPSTHMSPSPSLCVFPLPLPLPLPAPLTLSVFLLLPLPGLSLSPFLSHCLCLPPPPLPLLTWVCWHLQDWAQNELAMLEAAMLKMCRIVAHTDTHGIRGNKLAEKLQVRYPSAFL